ncbi:MAG: hypothetical protein ABSG37_09665 [Candidatus Limnocylindrales bacterium]
MEWGTHRIGPGLAALGIVAALLAGCSSSTATPAPATGAATSGAPAGGSAVITPLPTATLPPVEGPDPSPRVAAFYYPWYGTDHWQGGGLGASLANDDIMSDYYPVLGPYDSHDPSVVAQHIAWLRAAGIGVIVSSWWGRGSREDGTVPVVLAMAERYGIKVAFHIEPYGGRTADQLVDDVAYLYAQYGSSPAFFRTVAATPYDQKTAPQGLFFVWAPSESGDGGQAVEADYWRSAVDAIHASSQGGLVVGAITDASWIDGAHFDGLYDYTPPLPPTSGAFDWARSVPLGALYVPSVIPGFSAKRVDYPSSTYVARDVGATYDAEWQAALGTGVEPFLVTITSFNEWHEGTQIEPATPGHVAGTGRHYSDYSPLPPDGYLTLTRTWVDRFVAMTWPQTFRARISIRSTSDWTTVRVAGATLERPTLFSVTGATTNAGYDGTQFALNQPLDAATADKAVSMTWDVLLSGVTPDATLSIEIERGNLGSTTVTLYNYLGAQPVAVESVKWAGLSGGMNPKTVKWPARLVLEPAPASS